jgi:hypothetical protein
MKLKKHQQHPDDRDGVHETSENLHILRRLSARENYIQLLQNDSVYIC